MTWISKPLLGTQLDWTHPLNAGLVGFWLFNEGMGDKVYDLSGNANTGTLRNMAFPSTTTSGWNPGRLGPSIAFDRVDDTITVPISSSLQVSQTTISFWVKMSDINLSQGFIGRFSGNNTGNENRIFWENVNKRVRVFYRMNNVDNLMETGINVITDTNWHLITVVILNGSQQIYVDGVVKGTAAVAYPLQTGSANPGIGWTFAAGYLLGVIDEVRIYNRGLSNNEINTLLNNPYEMFLEACQPLNCTLSIM